MIARLFFISKSYKSTKHIMLNQSLIIKRDAVKISSPLFYFLKRNIFTKLLLFSMISKTKPVTAKRDAIKISSPLFYFLKRNIFTKLLLLLFMISKTKPVTALFHFTSEFAMFQSISGPNFRQKNEF